ncbi:tetratricopeptide repeat protein [Streptosporangium sp. NPDC049078]|uniref:tetratricopeptide repeat protein n=1 Tax=Streptosporangium sp. NPDC049078 TaxID=3155767 RepID=UPI0034403EAB
MSGPKQLPPDRQRLRDALRALRDQTKNSRKLSQQDLINLANRRLAELGLEVLAPQTVSGWLARGSVAQDFRQLWVLLQVMVELTGRLPPYDPKHPLWLSEFRWWKTHWEKAGTSGPRRALRREDREDEDRPSPGGLLLAADEGRTAESKTPRTAPSSLDPLYQPLPPGAPEVWLLQPRFGVVPYLAREGLLEELEAWCAEDRMFSIGVVSGEGGSGKSRLAAELGTRMRERGWDCGQVPNVEALTEFTPRSATLLVIDHPEQLLAVLGRVLEQLASRVAGPRMRVLLLTRQQAARSHWWAELDRTSHRTATGFGNLHLDLGAHALSPNERREHAETAMRAFGRYLGIDEVGAVPDLTDDDFANPLLVHVASLLAVHGRRRGTESAGSMREEVLAYLLAREQSRWARLRPAHQLADLHETHAVRAVLAVVLAGPSAGEAAELLAALPEFSGSAQRERRGRICYWLADLYPGQRPLASFGPDLLVEQLLDSAAGNTADLDDVIAAVHDHGATSARHRSRLLATLRLAAERRPGVFSALRGYLVKNLPALLKQALDDPDAHLATMLDSALVFCGERRDPELKLAFACAHLQTAVPTHHERGAQLLYTTMRLALPVFRGVAKIDPEDGLDALHVALHLLVLRSGQASQPEEALEWNLESVRVSRQLVDRDRDRYLAQLSFDLSNLAAAHIKLGQSREALAVAEEAVTLQRELAERGGGKDTGLAIALHRLSGIQVELGNYDQALVSNAVALPVLQRFADQGDGYYLPLLAEALTHRGAILTGQHRCEQALAAITEAFRLRERLAEQSPDTDLALLQYGLHNLSRGKENLGRYDDALADAARGVAISREACAANPRRHRILLIRNLNQVAQLHLRLAQPEQAVAAVEEAVVLARQGTEAELAESLAQLIKVLTSLGRYADALPVCLEAEPLLRRLIDSRRHLLPLLVSALTDLSQVLDNIGRPDEALDTAREATDFARRLDTSENSRLARALVNLGDRYARLQHFPEALLHTAEGIELLRTADQPAALATALAKLADRHARLDHRTEALAAALKAVLLSEAVHQSDPTRHRIDYAYALKVLSEIHRSFGRPADGLPPLARAVQLYRELAEADASDYHRSGLAAALHSLADLQVVTRQYHEAADSCRQGNQIYEQLADANEDHYLGRYAGSLESLRATLVFAERIEDALPVARRQVEVARRLVTKDPGFREFLTRSYGGLTKTLTSLGNFTEALRVDALAKADAVIPDPDQITSNPHPPATS